MRLILFAFLLGFTGCNGAAGADQPPDTRQTDARLPAGAVILPDATRASILQQCSRSTPEPGEAGWRPTAADIIALEAAAVASLRGRSDGNRPDWTRFPEDWRRQYVGIVRGGRRYVYGNAYPRGMDDHATDPDRWQREPAIVCDGGPSFFGIEYDVEARRITHLAFNGMA